MLRARKFFATVSASALLCGGVGVPIASAANQNQQGLVNVAVGDINANVALQAAVNIVAQVCGVNVGPVAVLATAVAAAPVTGVCTAPRQPGAQNFTITQVAGA